jgi:hypothetical protein
MVAPPAAAAPAPAPEAHAVHKPVVRPVKVARAQPSGKADKKADSAGDSADESDQAPVAKTAAKADRKADKKADKVAADQTTADDDQPAPSHRERASDDPEEE